MALKKLENSVLALSSRNYLNGKARNFGAVAESGHNQEFLSYKNKNVFAYTATETMKKGKVNYAGEIREFQLQFYLRNS